MLQLVKLRFKPDNGFFASGVGDRPLYIVRRLLLGEVTDDSLDMDGTALLECEVDSTLPDKTN